MSEQTTPQQPKATPAACPRGRAKLLSGLNPFFYNSGVDEPYPELTMIQALTSLLLNSSKPGEYDSSFPIDNDDMGWLILLISYLTGKIKDDVDAMFKDTSATWDKLEERALKLEAQLAALGGRVAETTVEAKR